MSDAVEEALIGLVSFALGLGVLFVAAYVASLGWHLAA